LRTTSTSSIGRVGSAKSWPTATAETLRSKRCRTLPEQIETAALERRGAWLLQKNRDVGETFAKYDLMSLDVRELAKRIEIDLTLVHAAYYLDDRSIGRIAEWIATFDAD
jgi:hypothetical protein